MRANLLHIHLNLVRRRHQCNPYGKYTYLVKCRHHHSNTFACTPLGSGGKNTKSIWAEWVLEEERGKILTFTLNAVTFIAIFASTSVWPDSIDTFRIFMAWMQISSAFIDFGTIEFIDTTKPRQAIAYIWADRVLTHRIQMTMITKLAALLCALINICNIRNKWSTVIYWKSQRSNSNSSTRLNQFYWPVHSKPFPWKPGRQVHEYFVLRLRHVAFMWQVWPFPQ